MGPSLNYPTQSHFFRKAKSLQSPLLDANLINLNLLREEQGRYLLFSFLKASLFSRGARFLGPYSWLWSTSHLFLATWGVLPAAASGETRNLVPSLAAAPQAQGDPEPAAPGSALRPQVAAAGSAARASLGLAAAAARQLWRVPAQECSPARMVLVRSWPVPQGFWDPSCLQCKV